VGENVSAAPLHLLAPPMRRDCAGGFIGAVTALLARLAETQRAREGHPKSFFRGPAITPAKGAYRAVPRAAANIAPGANSANAATIIAPGLTLSTCTSHRPSQSVALPVALSSETPRP